ncbi:MAG: hypothetical protein WBA77_14310 [Microcoleaceae cyanobacterium]
MKEIRFSQHSQTKLEVLADHGVLINLELICEIIACPDKLEIKEEKLSNSTAKNQ